MMATVSDYTSIYTPNHWTQTGVDNQPGFVTFSFYSSGASFDYLTGEGFASTFVNSITPLDSTLAGFVRIAIADWEAVSGLHFIEVPDGQGDIRFSFADFSMMSEYATFGGIGFWPYADVNSTSTYSGEGLGGDIFANTANNYSSAEWVGLFLHEIGHAIGMGHTHEDFASNLASNLADTQSNSIMSYNGDYTLGLGPFDIQTAQQAYGTVNGGHLDAWNWNSSTLT